LLRGGRHATDGAATVASRSGGAHLNVTLHNLGDLLSVAFDSATATPARLVLSF